ncbi:MAG: hypothetical protein KKH83_07975 [Candidatus Margulisbacteria bacterium]|nr:hypothetical protein [Candidatus Margulisiibacteriota bacterium]
MHQPYYKDLVSGEYFLPWAKLHGTKDYYDMAAILDDFPKVKLTFNLVPSLLAQIEDYVNDAARGPFVSLTEKDPASLSQSEKIFILHNFFMSNWETMVRPYKRYYDLLLKRGRFPSAPELKKAASDFRWQDFFDLQIWFNLSWFGFLYKNYDPDIKALIGKGYNFTRQDKELLLARQKEILKKIIPKYRELQDRGQVEISTSPFYHPILPLLCDTNSARESMPDGKLPRQRFAHPEDADEQIRRAVEYHEKLFGKRPRGMWPSEGSVSEAIIPLVKKHGLEWIASDVGILENSLKRGNLTSAEQFKPYLAKNGEHSAAIAFRDHFLSDQIGFVYQAWHEKEAAADFVNHLLSIKNSLPDDGKKYLVTVILDGENCWEYYRGLGEPFLRELYGALSDNPDIKTTTISEFIGGQPPADTLPHLFAGSWIFNNFRVWIGHDEDNRAWDLLYRARAALDNIPKEQASQAWEELYIAEGSDWCWWYGDDHSSENDEAFDALYRKHLKNIYTLLKKHVPADVLKPIKMLKEFAPTQLPIQLIRPRIDGLESSYYEWLPAGCFDIEKSKGAMHQTESIISRFYFGFDLSNLYIMVKTNLSAREFVDAGFSVVFFTHHPAELKIEKFKTYAVEKVIEFGIPFGDLKARADDKLDFSLAVFKDGKEIERWPRGGMINIVVPGEHFNLENWTV